MEFQDTMPLKWTKQVKVLNDGIKSLETIKPLADKFDGKVINKRFVKALNEVSDHNIVIFSLVDKGYDRRVGYNEKLINFYLTDRSFKIESQSCWGYIDEDDFTILEIDNDNFYVNADGRLVKDIFIKAIDKTIDRLNRKIEAFQDCIDHFDEYLNEVNKVNKALADLHAKLHYPMSVLTNDVELPFYYDRKIK